MEGGRGKGGSAEPQLRNGCDTVGVLLLPQAGTVPSSAAEQERYDQQQSGITALLPADGPVKSAARRSGTGSAPQLAIASFEISRVSNCLTTTIMNGMDTALTGHYVRACMPRPERGRQCVLLGALQPSYNHAFDCDYVGGLYWRHWSVCLL